MVTARPGVASASRSKLRDGARAGRGSVPYAELHCHSNFSFLDGASHPEELVTEAARLGLEALALTDHNGFYGIVRFAEAARELGMPTIFGTELTLVGNRRFRSESETLTQVATGNVPDATAPDPHGEHLLLLADGPTGTPSWPGRSASATWPGRRALRNSRSTMSPESWPVTPGRSPVVARAPFPLHLVPMVRPLPAASSTA